MKTAIQEVILKMQEAKDNFPNIGFDDEFIRGFNKAFQMAIFITEKVGIEKEKQQLIDAYDFGENDSDTRFPSFLDGEEYYNKTFEPKQTPQ